ncbi:starch synthase (maltosyl-transferring) [Phyllobacterium ifriqiyense]|uniref:Starch synthase (Maltosyl-transferring) n=1 Tax=Phyllobacterium ifriqiyense TaxID=314238 RepID=A0ABU0S3A1_9HYPH|nr:alpha-1,4-glucan--maltose-1-phosphate maltosyltransferase [Phyllobacterium ifriqiyense]MDQ0995202.1 starch synthase (maltosyl-transferring) [Phyllobacterium ifriqiyense]
MNRKTPTKDRVDVVEKKHTIDAVSFFEDHRRVVIENVSPQVNGGRFPAKCIIERPFTVSADILCDGHDVLKACVLVTRGDRTDVTAMQLVGNDKWIADIVLSELGSHSFNVQAWIDPFSTWLRDFRKKREAGQDIELEMIEGQALIERALSKGQLDDASRQTLTNALNGSSDPGSLIAPDVIEIMSLAGPRDHLARSNPALPLLAERFRAGFGAWYELFPRSQSPVEAVHGTFNDVVPKLSYVKEMGFDVLYFPPIHPIGRTNRKGPNNSLTASETDLGSPYAIGGPAGGHDAVHPQLGTIEDFDRLVGAATQAGLEIALDFAIQCSPDHPWISQHPQWFKRRPDGTIRFAENPPKKYEDIVNLDFYGPAKAEIWHALLDVVLFWIAHGVKIFRVDNPHTKPFPFWEWLIAEVRHEHEDVIFLAEAFTRPKIMSRLAKIGFSQSYSYFTWRNEKAELQDYLTQLTQGEDRFVMRPNFFANTPDINPFFLQESGKAGFQIRLVLAASLVGNYGIYSGFEICEAAAIPGKEEYLNSEKYQLRQRDFEGSDNIIGDIALINKLRATHAAFKAYSSLTFYNAWKRQSPVLRKNGF